MEDQQHQIVTESRMAYSVLQKVFCCKCFHCLQDVTTLTSDLRKQTLQKMIKNYVISEDEQTLFDPIKLLILIYLCEDPSIPQKHIEKCRLNPNVGIQTYRTDLEFYVPQLTSCTVFHNDLKENYLLHGLEKASRLSFYFGHLYYFYLASLQKIVDKYQIQVLKRVSLYKQKYLETICHTFQGQGLTSIQFFSHQKPQTYPVDSDIGYLIKSYGTKSQDLTPNPRLVSATDVTLPNYSSVFKNEVQLFSFRSTINFFEDLFLISEQLKSHQDKRSKLHEMLMIVNERLPACVYIPFSKNSIRLCNVLNIVVKESRVFSTKQRAPFYICLETYCPCENMNQAKQESFWSKVQVPITLKANLKSDDSLRRRSQSQQARLTNTTYHRNKMAKRMSDPFSNAVQTEILSERGEGRHINNKLLEFSNDMPTQPRLQKSEAQKTIQLKTLPDSNLKQQLRSVFGETLEQQQDRIRVHSIYSGLNSYDLVHIMVKTNDNLKQQQFAIQLIYQFDYIFKLQKLPLLLTPYQVLSMGPDCGILEMVKEAVTIDSLKKKMRTIDSMKYATLKEFFEVCFSESIGEAKQNFLRSLAAYSLVMYILQVKDRHNGNIMLHRSGKIFHIDFGFLLSNLPGKGVQLERDIPFKLLTEYIAVLDGPQSYYFKKFREYLFLGFKAARKHQNKILILVKMMYSSSGRTMPCFEKGEVAIRELEKRFNPPDIINDAQLNLHCQSLINASLDNWASKWYDRWQYWAQGIVY